MKITDLTKGLTLEAEAQIADLHTRIKEIYACINMDVRLRESPLCSVV